MGRRGAEVVGLVVGLLGLAACSGGADPYSSPTSTRPAGPPPTAPADAEPGTGTFVLGLESFPLEVESCSLTPTLDDETGVTTDLSVRATGPDGVVVTATRQTFTAAVATVTDTIDYVIEGGGGLRAEASRVDADGRILDLRDPAATGRLLEVLDDTLVVAEGRFGPPGARGADPADLGGVLVVRCP